MEKQETIKQQLQEQLPQLQDIDKQLHIIEITEQQTQAAIQTLEEEKANLDKTEEKHQQRKTEHEQALAKEKEKVKTIKTRVKGYQAQQEETTETKEKEHLQQEIETDKLEVALYQRKTRAIKEVIQHENEKIQALEEKKATIDILIAEKTQQQQQKESAEEQVALKKQREAVAKIIPTPILELYDKVKQSKQTPIAQVRQDVCTACLLTVAPQKQIDVLMYQKPQQCDNCSRLLIDVTIPAPVEQKRIRRRRTTTKRKTQSAG